VPWPAHNHEAQGSSMRTGFLNPMSASQTLQGGPQSCTSTPLVPSSSRGRCIVVLPCAYDWGSTSLEPAAPPPPHTHTTRNAACRKAPCARPGVLL
jgi:hypothetical protein